MLPPDVPAADRPHPSSDPSGNAAAAGRSDAELRDLIRRACRGANPDKEDAKEALEQLLDEFGQHVWKCAYRQARAYGQSGSTAEELADDWSQEVWVGVAECRYCQPERLDESEKKTGKKVVIRQCLCQQAKWRVMDEIEKRNNTKKEIEKLIRKVKEAMKAAGEDGDILASDDTGDLDDGDFLQADLDRLEGCLQILDPLERIIIGIMFLDREHGSIGDKLEELGLTRGQANTVRQRALRKLRACMEREEKEGGDR
jgi:DNA-directed RNA polymerase specialized sigma24 family protein